MKTFQNLKMSRKASLFFGTTYNVGMKRTVIAILIMVFIMFNPVAAYPKQQIEVSRHELVFGQIPRGNSKTLEFTVKTKATVSIISDKLWVELDISKLKTTGKVIATVKSSLLPIGTSHSGLIAVSSQGYDSAIIKVKVSTEKNIELKMKIDSATANLNGKTVTVKTPMRMKGCTPLVPLRFVCNILGATTFFNPKDSSIRITRLDRTIEILPDVEEYEVNGKKKISNPAPTTYEGVMFVPLGFISSAFGVCIDWDRTGKQGTIKLCY